jgi:hypothetical protein
MKFPSGVHKYIIQGDVVFADYIGRQKGFECCVCGKGCNAYTFNIIHANSVDDVENAYANDDYETWGFGADHLAGNVELIK